jgi:hypothetical protein
MEFNIFNAIYMPFSFPGENPEWAGIIPKKLYDFLTEAVRKRTLSNKGIFFFSFFPNFSMKQTFLKA